MPRPQQFDRKQVLQQALKVFWHQGYEATSMTDLMQATGLSKSSFYNTFASKHECLLEAFDSYRADRLRDMDRVLAGDNAKESIATFFRMIVSDAKAPEFINGCMSINQAVELAPHDEAIATRVDEDFQKIEDALAEAIERGQRAGSIATRRDARNIAQLMVVAFPGFQVLVRAGSPQTRLNHALDELLAILD